MLAYRGQRLLSGVKGWVTIVTQVTWEWRRNRGMYSKVGLEWGDTVS